MSSELFAPLALRSGLVLRNRIAKAAMEEGMAAGVVYESDDPEAIAEALGRCAAAIEPLRAQARALAPSWMRTHSAQAFLDWMEGEIAVRSLEPTRGLARRGRAESAVP